MRRDDGLLHVTCQMGIQTGKGNVMTYFVRILSNKSNSDDHSSSSGWSIVDRSMRVESSNRVSRHRTLSNIHRPNPLELEATVLGCSSIWLCQLLPPSTASTSIPSSNSLTVAPLSSSFSQPPSTSGLTSSSMQVLLYGHVGRSRVCQSHYLCSS